MTSVRKTSFLAAFLVLLGGVTAYEAHLASIDREQLEALRSRHQRLARQLENVRHQNDADLSTLADLQTYVGAASAAIPSRELDSSPAAVETRAWLDRLATARKLFADFPGAAIPELQLLDLRTWLSAVKETNFETSEATRKSLAAIRTIAKRQFTDTLLSTALRKYLAANNGELPTHVSALAPFFDRPIDPTLLERYKMVRSGNLTNAPASFSPILLEATPVDEEFDSRHGSNVAWVATHSRWATVPGSYGQGPAAWIDGYRDRLQRARAEFLRTYPATPNAGIADLAPFFNPPLDSPTVEKLIKAEQTSKP